MGRFEILEHTADVGIKAYGESLEELFQQASRGLAVIIGIWKPNSGLGQAGLGRWEQVVIDLKARDLGALLVDWLGEIVYIADVDDVTLTRVEAESVRRQDGSGEQIWRATGRLWLEPGSGEEAEGTAVKAITYHRLKVAPTAVGWTAEVYVDV